MKEPSVVQTPNARLFGGIPNATFGIVYYALLGSAIWLATQPWQAALLCAASAAAAIVSFILAYSLLFITKMPCRYCWSAHAVNWMLALCNVFYFIEISYWR